MARQSTIDGHPHKDKIVEMIANGVPAVQINRTYPDVSVYAISRYKVKRIDAVASILADDQNSPAEVIGRLADLADSARIARKLADVSQTPAVRARVITAELQVLDRLVKLSVDDTSVARLAQAAGPLVKTIQNLAARFPTEVFSELAKHEALTDLKTDLQTALKAQNGQTS